MDKQEIKTKLLEAVKSDPHVGDIKSVAIFGSYVAGEATDASDVDVLIDFEPEAKIGYFELAQIQRNFRNHLDKEIDLLTPQAISKYFREEVLRQAEYFYEG
jgi:hypothetical protein